MIAVFKGDIHLQSANDQEFEDDLVIEVNSNSVIHKMKMLRKIILKKKQQWQ